MMFSYCCGMISLSFVHDHTTLASCYYVRMFILLLCDDATVLLCDYVIAL